MSAPIFQVNALWDAEASVWVAISENVLRLATEAEFFDELQQKLRSIVPELLMLNQAISADSSSPAIAANPLSQTALPRDRTTAQDSFSIFERESMSDGLTVC